MSDLYLKPLNSQDIIHLNEDPTEVQTQDNQSLSSRLPLHTDLVKVYLKEIGRIPLYTPAQEIAEAHKIQSYLKLVKRREKLAQKGDQILCQFQDLLNFRHQLIAKLGHVPTLKQWAKFAAMEISILKQNLEAGKSHWANLMGLTVAELEQIEKAGLEAKENMIKANLRLVVSIAKKYQHRGIELLDLIQEGALGLERAVEKFDPTKGYRFSTYSYWWIRQGMTRSIATSSRTIRLPVHVTEKLNKIKKVQRELSQKLGRSATIEEMAQELKMTPEEIRETFQKVPFSISLDMKIGNERDTELGDLLETELDTPETTLIREALQRDLTCLLAELTSREREVICLRFGFTDGKSHSLASIARILELSRERIRQIEAKAMQKLRHPKLRLRIQDYLDN